MKLSITQNKNKESSFKSFLMLAPFLIIYSLFMLYPIIRGFIISFQNGSIGGEWTFAGFNNYQAMLKDSYFWESLRNTLLFVVLSTPLLIVIGLGFAMLVNANLKGTTILRAIFFLPYVLSISVIASIWVFIFQPYSGLLNTILGQIGITEQVFWLNDPNLAWISITIATVWWTVGFNMILFLAGLQEISDEQYEAADIDGATSWEKFIYITLPSLKNIFLLTIVLQTINSFKLFGQPYLMTSGGPGTATRALVQYIYEKGFIQHDMGVASAMSFVLLIVTVIFALVQFKFLQRDRK